ncbi:DgyrCDS14824 [Dimorphilus gyrociliatus]|uniref:DgyrCDS14824 n=1 Tax=Dimorphilus gyrociliatus TaxID=2664684 RepID=A0A7I8WF77_9ANNE|nr:DgyrCDS14824 [Dimorphilus gyrociliatus]
MIRTVPLETTGSYQKDNILEYPICYVGKLELNSKFERFFIVKTPFIENVEKDFCITFSIIARIHDFISIFIENSKGEQKQLGDVAFNIVDKGNSLQWNGYAITGINSYSNSSVKIIFKIFRYKSGFYTDFMMFDEIALTNGKSITSKSDGYNCNFENGYCFYENFDIGDPDFVWSRTKFSNKCSSNPCSLAVTDYNITIGKVALIKSKLLRNIGNKCLSIQHKSDHPAGNNTLSVRLQPTFQSKEQKYFIKWKEFARLDKDNAKKNIYSLGELTRKILQKRKNYC